MANILPKIEIQEEPEDGVFDGVILEIIPRENDTTAAEVEYCRSAVTTNTRFGPEQAALLQVIEESDLQVDHKQLENTTRADSEELANPRPATSK
jgi:hypothetical protein